MQPRVQTRPTFSACHHDLYQTRLASFSLNRPPLIPVVLGLPLVGTKSHDRPRFCLASESLQLLLACATNTQLSGGVGRSVQRGRKIDSDVKREHDRAWWFWSARTGASMTVVTVTGEKVGEGTKKVAGKERSRARRGRLFPIELQQSPAQITVKIPTPSRSRSLSTPRWSVSMGKRRLEQSSGARVLQIGAYTWLSRLVTAPVHLWFNLVLLGCPTCLCLFVPTAVALFIHLTQYARRCSY